MKFANATNLNRNPGSEARDLQFRGLLVENRDDNSRLMFP
jgi:hypothetical protein